MKRYVILIYLLSAGWFLPAQVVINEVCSRNSNLVGDEDGDHPDWIELYNAGSAPVNLLNYGLSDDSTQPLKWRFPDVVIQPHSFLTVFASGKNKISTIDHWGSVVQAEQMWKYYVPTSNIGHNWVYTWFNDQNWPVGTGGWGYGDGDDNTVVPNNTVTVYIRMPFVVVDTSVIGSAFFHMDYDDGFVAYLNGKELTRSNIGVTNKPPAWDELAYDEHEARMYQGMAPESFYIAEKDLKKSIISGVNILAVEVHNVDTASGDLTARPYLTLGIKDQSTFYIPPPAWFNVPTSWLHTNFKLSKNGEEVVLADSMGNILDMVVYPYTQLDNSYGRQPDGAPNWYLFNHPTPNASNNAQQGYTGYTSNPVFSLPAGFYPNPLTLAITTSTPGAAIHYTLDGTKPDQNSPVYTGPLALDSTTVVRARVYSGTLLPSEVETNTYFINDSSALPVISISTAPGYFFDWDTGIYMEGPNADPKIPHFGANYWQDWEIPIHMEYFNAEGVQQFEQDFGCKINGGWSRSHPQKSLRILARSEYGKARLDYQLFPDKPIYSYKRFILRNSGNETNVTHFRDALMHKNVQKDTHNDIQDYQPAVVYINGQYWGVHNIREKISQFYLEENYGVNPDAVDLLQWNGYVIEGFNDDFLDMADFIYNQNMAIQANYDSVKQWLDIENFVDYFATQTYYVNWDWPQNNVKYWRDRAHKTRWRYILTDLDMGLGFSGTFTQNDLHRARTATNNFHSFLFNSLLDNQEFREYFINRYADLINTTLGPDHLGALAMAFKDSIKPEMPRHFARWYGNMNQWENWNIGTVLMNFINERPFYARKYIKEEFNLVKQVPITLDVYPPGAGKIHINTIEPEPYPWGGIYFDGVPITITAVPNPGYQFSFWQSNKLIPNPDTSISITLNVDTFDVFTAYFFGSPDTERVVINEINYNSGPNINGGDWVELHNYGNIPVDIGGWVFKDSVDAHQFVIPQGTVLKPDDYLVLVRDSLQFQQAYPGVSNYIGSFGFGLSSQGEWLRLYDDRGKLRVSVTYLGGSPWPSGPNGNGPTLELLDPWSNLDNPMNWFSGCEGGSPGGAFVPCYTATGPGPDQPDPALRIYPNPAYDQAMVEFMLDKSETVRITLHDVFGREIQDIFEGQLPAGTHYFRLPVNELAKGVYFVTLQTEMVRATRKVQVLH